MAKLNNRKPEETPIVMENIQFRRATIVSRDTPVRFLINVLDGTGEFDVCEGGAVVVTGTVRLADDPAAERLRDLDCTPPRHEDGLLPLVTDDIYKELRLRGYNYGGIFRGIRASDPRGTCGELAWDNNWISFMDTMLQFGIIGVDTRELYLPTRLQRALIDPAAQLAAVAALAEGGTLPVRMHRDIDVISAGGIEFRGVKTSLAPRRANPQNAPKLEKYVFLPYDNAAVATEDTSRSKRDALTVSLQLVLENAGALKLKLCEAALDRPAEALLTPQAMAVLEAEPQVRVDASLAAGPAPAAYAAAVKDLGVKVFPKDGRSAPVETDCHLVMAADVLSRHGAATLENLAAALGDSGMMLLEEPHKALDERAAKDMVERAGLTCVSRQVAASCEYVLLRRQPGVPERHVVIDVGDDTGYAWVDALREALARAEGEDMRVYCVARAAAAGVLGLCTCLRGEAGGRALRCYYLPGAREPFRPDAAPYAAQARRDMAVNVLRAGVWGCYRHLPLGDAEAQLQVEHAYVNTLTRGDLSSLRWIESPVRYAREVPQPARTDLCRVYCAPLNFRDIMLATGKLPPDALPGNLAGQVGTAARRASYSGRE